MHYLTAAALLIVIAAIYRFAINTWYLTRIRSFRKEHHRYFEKLIKKEHDDSSWGFVKKVPEIKALIAKAGVEDQILSFMEPAGLGFAQQKRVSVLDNISANNSEIIHRVINTFYLAEGVFESRRRDAYNLFFWTETIIYLPSNILSYIGLPRISVWARVANVIGWVATVVGFITSLPDFAGVREVVSQYLAAITTIGK